MFHKRNSLGGRKVSPPQPTCMTPEQKSSYLNSLRNNRPARPGGSRPLPASPRKYDSSVSDVPLTITPSVSAASIPQQVDEEKAKPEKYRSSSGESAHSIPKSVSFSASTTSLKGRPLARAPDDQPVVRGRKVSPTATIQVPYASDGVYVENPARRLEKEEAQTIRQALELMDHQDDDKRIHTAAQDEAADLVWKHQNPHLAEDEKTAPYRNPDLTTSTRRRSSGHRLVSSGSKKAAFPNPESQIYEEPEQTPHSSQRPSETPSSTLPLRAKSRNSLPWLKRANPERSESAPVLSKKDKYDHFKLNSNPRIQSNNAEYTTNTPPPAPAIDVIDEVDTPQSTKSINGIEVRSDDIRAATSMKRKDRSPNLPTPTAVSDQLGRPIVSFDKTWKPSSDSPRNSQDAVRPVIKMTESPTPARHPQRPLSDSPRNSGEFGRPATKPTDTAAPVRAFPGPGSATVADSVPQVTVSAPSIPTITFPDAPAPSPMPVPEIPTIQIAGDDEPTGPVINVEAHDERPAAPRTNIASSRPLPTPHTGGRPLPKHSSTHPGVGVPTKSPSTRVPWLNHPPSSATVSCTSCALPISGRIVTASGSVNDSIKARFHPECFSCHHCSTSLEAVAFYPEPEQKRLERFEAEGIDPASPEAQYELRFYCHLDFHEFFSPRCRSCKTPIEGEVIVAAGAEWHVGHFFCGECGDPFDSHTPFVEKDGYAFCVACHTKRTSARCRKCKGPILDQVTVEALGGKYHEHCFVCDQCAGGFGDEGRFFVRDVDVEPTEKEKRRGISRKVEERAVCGPCEEMRLKA